jgi:hypothetical protein
MIKKIPYIYNYKKQYKKYNKDISDELKKINVENAITYSPMFKLLFKLNDSNHNTITLNNKYQIHSIKKVINYNSINLNCIEKHKNKNTHIKVEKDCFVKYAPLVDPFKYLCGNEEHIEDKIPVFDINNQIEFNSIVDSPFNPSYVDSFFSYLSSQLKNTYNLENGIDFYGSFCGIKNNFKVSISDEFSLLNNSTFFMEQNNKLFTVDNNIEFNYEEKRQKKEPIKIDEHTVFVPDVLNNELMETFFSSPSKITNDENNNLSNSLKEVIFNMDELENINIENEDNNEYNSDCSSTTSYTNSEYEDDNNSDEFVDVLDNTYINETDESDDDSVIHEDEDDDEDEDINAYINKFPVNVILLEKCCNTLDSYIENNDIEELEMKSILLQILFTLSTYQHCFDFSHNDLHSNNIMYCKTKEKYLYYRLAENKPLYKVPTFGKLWKIIDFGRSIYKLSNHTIENMCYSDIGDATTQYNFGKLYSPKYNKREPNKNFDLCRLGCSLFDYFLDSDDDMDFMSFNSNMDQIVYNNDEDNNDKDNNDNYNIINLILKWITDSDNHNILYKSSGDERYPGFKLYKMIAKKATDRCCPFKNIESPYFKEFIIQKKSKYNKIINNKSENVFVVKNVPKFYINYSDLYNNLF